VFENYKPAAVFHLLVIPRRHLESVKTLDASHISLVQDMLALGDEALTSVGAPEGNRRFGFHIPPFTSVDHLHLHCFGLPFRSTLAAWKYPVHGHRSRCKAISWFAEVRQVISILKRGERVGVFTARASGDRREPV